MNLLEVKNLNTSFHIGVGTVQAVRGIYFHVGQGESLGIVGESGSGKSVTMLSVTGLLPDNAEVAADTIRFDGRELTKLSKKQLRARHGSEIGMIFQDPMTSLNPVMSVGEQIAESVRLHENVGKHEAIQRAMEMLELVGIPGERAIDYPHQFSGGMKQRVVIAIALACNPRILIADEPTTALDVTIQAQVLSMMNDLKTKFNTALVMITHDLGVVAKMCDDVAIVYAGRIVESGSLEDVFNHTMHPYTEGLFNSLPNIDNREAELKPIPGLMPDPTHLPKGCAFAPRCRYATEACREKQPEVRHVTDTHTVCCSRYDEPDFQIEGWQ